MEPAVPANDLPDQSILVIPLNECADYAPILAFWSYREWYLTRDIPFDAVLKSYKNRAGYDTLPAAFVATVRTMPAGMVSLKFDDLWTRKDLNPWLASLYVLPEYRKMGIAGMLIRRVLDCAAAHNLERIYLFLGQDEKDHLRSYYMERGWEFFECAVDNDGHETEIYCYSMPRGHKP